jgi:hypothetical protein
MRATWARCLSTGPIITWIRVRSRRATGCQARGPAPPLCAARKASSQCLRRRLATITATTAAWYTRWPGLAGRPAQEWLASEGNSKTAHPSSAPVRQGSALALLTLSDLRRASRGARLWQHARLRRCGRNFSACHLKAILLCLHPIAEGSPRLEFGVLGDLACPERIVSLVEEIGRR